MSGGMKLSALFLALVSTLPAQSTAVQAALATGTYFPLDVGDRWVYREDTRFSTATYQTWRVDRTAASNGNTYAVMAIEGPGTFYWESWFRTDDSGKIYLLTGMGDVLFFDPAALRPNAAELQLTGPGSPVSFAGWGTFPDAVHYVNQIDILDYETGILARGIGLLTSTETVEAGSSGGPELIRTLVEAHLAGGIDFPATESSLDLSIESTLLDVGNKKVTNCAVPCYFAACGLAPGADPPNTYKPCARARVALKNWPAGQSRSVTLQLVAPGGTLAFASTLAMDSTADSVTYLQVPLYSAPNQPFAPGSYQLQASTADGAAQSSLTVKIQ
jgi:hypothetical protein